MSELIPFDIHQQEWDVNERLTFWESMRPWFMERGYDLFQQVGGDSDQLLSPKAFPEAPNEIAAKYPHAAYQSTQWTDSPFKARIFGDSGVAVFYGMDNISSRQIVIKAVRQGCDEHKILELIFKTMRSREDFVGVVPVLEIIPYGEYRFVIMPRWGTNVLLPEPTYMYEVVDFILPLLKGLEFLHNHNIVHRDLASRNLLVNQVVAKLPTASSSTRRRMRTEGVLLYAICDFNSAVLFPSGLERSLFRLPYHKSWLGNSFDHPFDTAHGELDYDPFAFDVGNLGIFFCRYFQHTTPCLPILAPLFDMMITRDISKRFTASQARRFLEERLLEVAKEDLNTPIPPLSDTIHPQYDDRWQNLPPDFVEKWSHCRNSATPRLIHFIRYLCRYEWIHNTVIFMRRVFAWCWQ